MKINLIGISGYAKSGKSTIYSMLKQIGAKEIAFADHLKNTCSKVFNIPRVNFDDQNLKEIPFEKPIHLNLYQINEILSLFKIDVDVDSWIDLTTRTEGTALISPRHIAQYIGTDVLRSLDQDIHIKTALSKIVEEGIYVCSDVRFLNELENVKKAGGFVIGVQRDSVKPDLSKVHISESFIEEIVSKSDYKIVNNGTLEELQNAVRLILEKEKIKAV